MAKDYDAFDCLKIIMYKAKRYNYFSRHETEKEFLNVPVASGACLAYQVFFSSTFSEKYMVSATMFKHLGSTLKSRPLFHVAERIDWLPCFL